MPGLSGVSHVAIIKTLKSGRISIERLVRILNALDQRVELRIVKAPGRTRKAA